MKQAVLGKSGTLTKQVCLDVERAKGRAHPDVVLLLLREVSRLQHQFAVQEDERLLVEQLEVMLHEMFTRLNAERHKADQEVFGCANAWLRESIRRVAADLQEYAKGRDSTIGEIAQRVARLADDPSGTYIKRLA